MRNPKFKSISPNYRKRSLKIELKEGKKVSTYFLPFSTLTKHTIDTQNRFKEISILSETGGHAIQFTLTDGSQGDFPADLVLYYCDPTYEWSALNQLKQALRDKLKKSELSFRVLADALQTSPAQVIRLLNEEQSARQFTQLCQLAALAGYEITFQLHKKSAA